MGLYSWLEKKEGGFWGVVVIFAAFMIQIPSFGTAQSFGIYNMYLLKYFKDASPAAVALIGSINVGVFLGSGNYPSLSLSLYLSPSLFHSLSQYLSLSVWTYEACSTEEVLASARQNTLYLPYTCNTNFGWRVLIPFWVFFFPSLLLSLSFKCPFFCQSNTRRHFYEDKCLNCITEILCYLLKWSICHSWMV